MKAPVGGIGTSICNQIVQYFLLHLGPNGVGKQEYALYLGFGVKELSTGPASDAAAEPTEEILCLGKVCGLFPGLCSHDVMGSREETRKVVGHCGGCT